MDLELRGSVFSLYYRWCFVFICEWNQVAPTPPPLFPWSSPLCHLMRPQEGWGAVGLGGMPELNSNSPPSNQPGRRSHFSNLPQLGGCHGSQVFPTHTHTHTIHCHPLRAPPKLQHYPHLLHYYALLSPTMLSLSFSLPFPHTSFLRCSFPRAEIGGVQTAGDPFLLCFLFFEECIDI